MNVNLVGDYVRLRVLDGNNFSKVICDYSFYDKGYFPDDGTGIHFNRQITLCDTDEKLGTGLYFRNASFSNSYLYNNSGYAMYSSSNTESKRRGPFEASWTTINKNTTVTVHSSQEWYEEKVSIEFK